MKHCNITDATQLAKQSDPMQTFLFGESKASELNFVGDREEKVSIGQSSPKRTQTPTKPSLHTNRPERIHSNRRLPLPSPGTFLPMSTSSIICSESIHQGAAKCPCIDSNKQYNNHCLYQQKGGCQKVSPRSLCKTPLGLVSTKAYHPEGRTHSGSPQHNRIQGVTRQTGFFRLAPEPTILSYTNEGSESMYDQPFCKKNQSPASTVLQLQT